MKIIEVEHAPLEDWEARVPFDQRSAIDDDLLQREQRLLAGTRKSAQALRQLRDEYRGQIRSLVGEAKIREIQERYARLIAQFAELPSRFPHTPEGEREEGERWQQLKQEKHELYHGLGFDTKKAIALRKRYLDKARVAIESSIDLDAEMPRETPTEPPRATSNPWTWVAPPYLGQWTWTPAPTGSAGYRWRSATASAKTGEVHLWSAMDLFGADDSDWSTIGLMGEVGFWFQMPAAGAVEAWIYLLDINADYSGQLRDESGCSDAAVEQLSRAYIWTSGSVERYSTLIDYRRGESEGSWAISLTPGKTISRNLLSQKAYAGGEWVYVTAGVRDLNYFWVDDMSCQSRITSQWSVKYVAVRSTGAP